MDLLGINDIKRAHHAMDDKPLLYKVFVWSVAFGIWMWFYYEIFVFLKQYGILP